MNTAQDASWVILGESSRQFPPFPKADFAIKDVSATSASLCAVITQGNSHARCFRSTIGAELARSCALKLLEKELENSPTTSQPGNAFITNIVSGIIAAWKEAVAKHFVTMPLSSNEQTNANPIEPSSEQATANSLPLEIYDTGILLLIMFHKVAYLICIGTGQILIINEDGQLTHITNQILSDNSLYLANTDVQNVMTISTLNMEKNRIEFIFMASDGYGASFQNQDGLIKAAYDFSRLLDIQGKEFVSQHLPVWLDKTIQNGSGKSSALVIVKRIRRWYDGLAHAISRETLRIDGFIADTTKTIHDMKYAISQQKIILDKYTNNDKEIQAVRSSLNTLDQKIDSIQEKLSRQYRFILIAIPALLVFLIVLSMLIIFAVNYA